LKGKNENTLFFVSFASLVRKKTIFVPFLGNAVFGILLTGGRKNNLRNFLFLNGRTPTVCAICILYKNLGLAKGGKREEGSK
jgi:hypothetical protein